MAKLACWVVLCCLSMPGAAQTLGNARPLQNFAGMYQIEINGAAYVAMPDAQWRQSIKDAQTALGMAQDLARLEEEVKKYRDLAAQFEKLRQDYAGLTEKYHTLLGDSLKLGDRYSETGRNFVQLTTAYGTLVNDYDALARKYRDLALESSPREAIDLGIGVVHAGDEDRLVAMAGIGTRVFKLGLRGWVFGGQDTYGVLMGVSF